VSGVPVVAACRRMVVPTLRRSPRGLVELFGWFGKRRLLVIVVIHEL
jgi:hypothetical protein